MNLRRWSSTVLALVIVAILIPQAARASQPRPLDLTEPPLGGYDIQQPVEQQTDWVSPPECSAQCPYPSDRTRWVTNPTGCTWDADDWSHQVEVNRYMSAGYSTTGSLCEVVETSPVWHCVYGSCTWWSNGGNHFVGVRVSATSPGLVVKTCYPQRCFTAREHPDPDVRGSYLYTLCSQIVYDPGDPAIGRIPESNGGLGMVASISVTVQNTTTRTVKQVSATVDMTGWGWQLDRYCDPAAIHSEYPFSWAT